MDSVPTADAKTGEDRSVIDLARRALKAHGKLTREQAAKLLDRYPYDPPLTGLEREQILNRYPARCEHCGCPIELAGPRHWRHSDARLPIHGWVEIRPRSAP